MEQLRTLSMALIRPNPENPRRKISEEELTELAQSIKSVGLLQPITVREKIIGHTEYEIVCGHRRYAAAQLAGSKFIMCIVRELTDEQAYEVMITENLQRKDIDPFDEAAAFASMKSKGYDVQSLADRFGKSQSYIYGRIRLVELIPEFVERYEKGDVQLSHCMLLSKLSTDMQKKMLDKYYCGDYYDLSSKPVVALESAVKSASFELSHQYFDTKGCEGCIHNTATGAIFQDMCVAKCVNTECFAKKYVEAVYPYLEEARRLNPDFFILTDKYYHLTLTACDQELEKKLKAEGFKFREGHSYDYERICGKNKFDHQGKAVCFALDYNGMLAKAQPTEVSNSTRNVQCKIDGALDNMANNRHDEELKIKREIITDRISALDDNALRNNGVINIEAAMRAALIVLASGYGDVEAFGIKQGDDSLDILAAALKLQLPELTAALAKFAALDDALDGRGGLVSSLFPEQSRVDDAEVAERFYEKCRGYWRGYDNVTVEMIEADLAERINKTKV